MDAKNTKIRFTLNGINLDAVHLEVSEALSSCFTLNATILSTPDSSPAAMVGTTAACELRGPEDYRHTWGGIITQACEQGINASAMKRFDITLRPRLWCLSQKTDHRVIQGFNVPDLVKLTLANHGFDTSDAKWHLTNSYAIRPYTVQYGETDLEFVERLLGDSGIGYCIRYEEGRDIIHFSDHNADFPYVDLDTIPLLPASGAERTQASFHRFGKTARTRPKRIALHDWNEMVPSTRILAGDIPGKTGGSDTIYGQGETHIESALSHAQAIRERYQVEHEEFRLEGDVALLAPGLAFTFFHPELSGYSGDYIVTEIQHRVSQHAGLELEEHDDLAYQNIATLIHREQPFRPAIIPKPLLPAVYAARVENNGPYALLDEWGRLKIKNLFDQASTAPAEGSRYIRRAQPYAGIAGDGGTATGIHTPLLEGAEVLWGSVDGDPDRPVILGAVTHPLTPSVATSDNPAQNRIRTMGGNEWLLDDLGNKEKIELKQGVMDEPFNLFRLDASHGANKMKLACTHGAMTFFAKKTTTIHAGDTITQIHGNDRTEVIQNEASLATRNRDIHYQAATDQKHTARKNIKQTAKQNIEHQAAQVTLWRARKNVVLTIKQGDQIISVNNSTLHIQSPNRIDIRGQGGGSINIGQQGGGIEIDSGGNVRLYGNKVTLKGASGVTFNGNTAYDIGGAPSLSTSPLATLKITDIPWLETEQNPDPGLQDLVINITDEFITTLPNHKALLDGTEYRIVTDLGEIREGKISEGRIEETQVKIAAKFDLQFIESGSAAASPRITEPDTRESASDNSEQKYKDVILNIEYPAGSGASYNFILSDDAQGYRSEKSFSDDIDPENDTLDFLFEQVPVPGTFKLVAESDIGTETVFEGLEIAADS